jgi:hypothetical protein
MFNGICRSSIYLIRHWSMVFMNSANGYLGFGARGNVLLLFLVGGK